MTYSAVLPFTGYTGWKFLQRTMTSQQVAFSKSTEIKRDVEYFTKNIGKIKTAEALVKDRTLLKVALGAFNLDGDISKKYFLQKILQEGTTDEKALANKLSDKRYFALAESFGFDIEKGPNTSAKDFSKKITDLYKSRGFEVSVGEKDANMRLALNIERDLPILAAKDSSDATKWYTILGTPSMRKVFEGAFGLSSSFASMDIDAQVRVLKARAASTFGATTIDQFAEPDKMEKLIRLFLVRTDAQTSALSSTSSLALQILQARNAT